MHVSNNFVQTNDQNQPNYILTVLVSLTSSIMLLMHQQVNAAQYVTQCTGFLFFGFFVLCRFVKNKKFLKKRHIEKMGSHELCSSYLSITNIFVVTHLKYCFLPKVAKKCQNSQNVLHGIQILSTRQSSVPTTSSDSGWICKHFDGFLVASRTELFQLCI